MIPTSLGGIFGGGPPGLGDATSYQNAMNGGGSTTPSWMQNFMTGASFGGGGGGGAPGAYGGSDSMAYAQAATSAAQNPMLTGALTAALGPIGMGLSAVGSLGGAVLPFLGIGKESKEAKIARQKWERTQGPVRDVYSQLFYNPAMEGMQAPNSKGGAYAWQPRESTKQLYAAYLNRNWGVPSTVSRAMASQAMSPLRVGGMSGTPYSSASLASQTKAGAGAYAQAQLGTMQGAIMEQQRKLQGANELAQYNLWRAQQLPELIG